MACGRGGDVELVSKTGNRLWTQSCPVASHPAGAAEILPRCDQRFAAHRNMTRAGLGLWSFHLAETVAQVSESDLHFTTRKCSAHLKLTPWSRAADGDTGRRRGRKRCGVSIAYDSTSAEVLNHCYLHEFELDDRLAVRFHTPNYARESLCGTAWLKLVGTKCA